MTHKRFKQEKDGLFYRLRNYLFLRTVKEKPCGCKFWSDGGKVFFPKEFPEVDVLDHETVKHSFQQYRNVEKSKFKTIYDVKCLDCGDLFKFSRKSGTNYDFEKDDPDADFKLELSMRTAPLLGRQTIENEVYIGDEDGSST